MRKSRRPEKSSRKPRKKSVERSRSPETIPFVDTFAKDFSFLANAPISEDDHFVFKSEKTWNVEDTNESELFTLDLKLLSLAISSIPFHENVGIEERYLTSDQLTSVLNDAEKSRQEFEKLTNTVKETKETMKEEGEDLEFLLSLNEPLPSTTFTRTPISSSYSDSKMKPPTKPMDLEAWLDSVLDD